MEPNQHKNRFSLTVLLGVIGVLSFCVFVCFSREKIVTNNALENREELRFEFPSKLRVATYNLHNFREENRFSAEGKFHYKYPKPEKEKRALYRTILAVNPDVLAVQEIGGDVWLEELAEALEQDGLSFPYRVLLSGYDRYNRLAILSRVPFSKTIEIPAPKKLTRGLLGVVIPVAGGKSFSIYTVHLKSKVSSDPDDPESEKRRLREARYVRRLIDFGVDDEKTAEKIPSSVRFSVPARLKKMPPELFALIGDFNDIAESSSLAPLEASVFAKALPAVDSEGGILTFFNSSRGYFHTFDRILVSPDVFRKHYVPESAKIADFPWAESASDHRLVYADFDFSKVSRRELRKTNGDE